MPEDGAPVAASPPQEVARLMDGYLTTQLLYVAAKLDIAAVLADGPQAAERWPTPWGCSRPPSGACCGD